MLAAAVDAAPWWALAPLGAGRHERRPGASAAVQRGRPPVGPVRHRGGENPSIVSALSRVGAISVPVVVGPLTGAFGLSTVFAVMAGDGLLVLLTLPGAVHRGSRARRVLPATQRR